jgi:hypothetical protein
MKFLLNNNNNNKNKNKNKRFFSISQTLYASTSDYKPNTEFKNDN